MLSWFLSYANMSQSSVALGESGGATDAACAVTSFGFDELDRSDSLLKLRYFWLIYSLTENYKNELIYSNSLGII